jgi:probable phosphoglycerate mutase
MPATSHTNYVFTNQLNPDQQMSRTIIDLIRHGEPVGGRAYRGNGIDDPLSDKGWTQMREAVGNVCHWDLIVTSPLKRCSKFADELAGKYQLEVHVEQRFKEIGFGEWEGMTADDLKKTRLSEYEAFYHDPVHSPPTNAEPLLDFFHRVTDAYKDVVEAHAGKRILLVAHAGVIRVIIAHVRNITPEHIFHIKVENAGMVRITHNQYNTELVLSDSITMP